jgi:IS30 family transposase
MGMWIKLSLEERKKIETLVNRGICTNQIGYALGRTPKVIVKEFIRAGGRDGYVAERAHDIALKNIKKSIGNLRPREKGSSYMNKKVTVYQPTPYEEARDLIEELKDITGRLERIYDNIRTATY